MARSTRKKTAAPSTRSTPPTLTDLKAIEAYHARLQALSLAVQAVPNMTNITDAMLAIGIADRFTDYIADGHFTAEE